LKKGERGRSEKKIGFAEGVSVREVSPLPRECYGSSTRASKEERRWTVRE